MLQRMVHDKEVTFCMLSAKNIKCNQLLLGMHPMICYFIFCLAFIRSVCVWVCVCVLLLLSPSGLRPYRCSAFYITLRHVTVDRTPLDEWSARLRNSTWKHTTLTTDRHPYPRGIRNRNHSKRVAADTRLWPRGHWDRHVVHVKVKFILEHFVTRVHDMDRSDWVDDATRRVLEIGRVQWKDNEDVKSSVYTVCKEWWYENVKI